MAQRSTAVSKPAASKPVASRPAAGPSAWQLFGLALIAFVAVSLFAGVLFWNWYVIEVKEIPIEVSVTGTGMIGFNTGIDKLYFGTVAPDGASERRTTVVAAKESIVVIKVEGEVAPWVAVSRNNVRLEPNQHEDIIFRLTAPANASPGNYTGTAVIQYHRPMFWE